MTWATSSWRISRLTRSRYMSRISSARGWSLTAASDLLLFFAGNADPGPRNGIQPRLGNRLAAVLADAKVSLFDPHQRFIDRLKNLRVGLLQPQLNVDFVVACGLVGHVTLAAVVVLHRIGERLKTSGLLEFGALLEQRVLVGRDVHAAMTPTSPCGPIIKP